MRLQVTQTRDGRSWQVKAQVNETRLAEDIRLRLLSDSGWSSTIFFFVIDAVINYVNEKKTGVVFMLWGSHAQKKGVKINKSVSILRCIVCTFFFLTLTSWVGHQKHLVLKAVHPSPLSAHRGFLQCNHFAAANKYLRDNAKDEINWNCLT